MLSNHQVYDQINAGTFSQVSSKQKCSVCSK